MSQNKTNEKFVHLHNHSHYSRFDGLATPEEIASAAKEAGFSQIALTDHGTCAGLYQFQKACRDEGIKPILGNEVYVTDDHTIKEKNTSTYHLVLLAKNKTGIKNLMRLSTLAEINGMYRKPRIDFNLLTQYHEGLICSSGCPAGELSTALIEEKYDYAYELANKYRELFGDDYYIEIMMHKYYSAKSEQEKLEKVLARRLYDLAKKANIKAICTNDCHYARKSDAKCQDIFLAMNTGDTIKNPNRFSFFSDEFYIKSVDEMMKFYSKTPELLSNTLEIAEKIENEDLICFSPDLLPNYDIPPDFESQELYLKRLIKDGLIAKGFSGKKEYVDRIKFEFEAIVKCGYVRYFLILWDVIRFCNEKGVRVGAGRGSAAGSLCLYVIGVTKVDPIKYDLLFERFINPERISPPDVDLDFDYNKRDQVFQYVFNKYGKEFCCKVGTFNKLGAKNSIRYATKALDLGGDWEIYQKEKNKVTSGKVVMTKNSLMLADYISKKIPEVPGITFDDAMKTSEEFRNAIQGYPQLIDICRKIEGRITAYGVHAAGIVACKDLISNHIPLRLAKGGEASEQVVCSQFDKDEVEELGLLKFDFLGLKTITVIDNTIELIRQRRGIDLDIDGIEPNDPKVLEIFNGKYRNIDNRGIFQFESYGMVRLLQSIHVDSFNDLVVANALYRPGPLGAGTHDLYCDYKHGRKAINPLHPEMANILKDTYGIIVFQEDFMKIAQKLAGFTRGQSDVLRKAVGKKKLELLKEQEGLFVSGCMKNGISETVARKIFEQINYFGGYGFNKCLSGDTWVLNKIDNFFYSLKDLCKFQFGSKYGRPIVLDSYVDGKTIEDEVVEVFETGEKELFEVELTNGMIIKCTIDHKFYCDDGKPHTLREIIDGDLEIFYEEDDDIKENIQRCKVKSTKPIGKAMAYNLTMKSSQHNYAISKSGKRVFSANSHSLAYSFISYQTAYLKFHYPIEFMCSLLNSEIDNQDKNRKLGEYITQAYKMGIVVKKTDINRSKEHFIIESGKDADGKPYDFIRSPLTVLNGLGSKAAVSIVENQPFPNLSDFLRKIDGRKVNKKVFGVLLEAGSFDEAWKAGRKTIEESYDKIRLELDKEKKLIKKNQIEAEKYGNEDLFSKIMETGDSGLKIF